MTGCQHQRIIGMLWAVLLDRLLVSVGAGSAAPIVVGSTCQDAALRSISGVSVPALAG